MCVMVGGSVELVVVKSPIATVEPVAGEVNGRAMPASVFGRTCIIFPWWVENWNPDADD